MGRKVPVVTEQARIRPENSEVNRLLADNRLITELTGWKSEVPFREGLARTVEWIGRNLQYFDTERYAR